MTSPRFSESTLNGITSDDVVVYSPNHPKAGISESARNRVYLASNLFPVWMFFSSFLCFILAFCAAKWIEGDAQNTMVVGFVAAGNGCLTSAATAWEKDKGQG